MLFSYIRTQTVDKIDLFEIVMEIITDMQIKLFSRHISGCLCKTLNVKIEVRTYKASTKYEDINNK